MKLSALGGPEVDSENAEIRSESQIEEIEVERGMEPEVKHLHSRDVNVSSDFANLDFWTHLTHFTFLRARPYLMWTCLLKTTQ